MPTEKQAAAALSLADYIETRPDYYQPDPWHCITGLMGDWVDANAPGPVKVFRWLFGAPHHSKPMGMNALVSTLGMDSYEAYATYSSRPFPERSTPTKEEAADMLRRYAHGGSVVWERLEPAEAVPA